MKYTVASLIVIIIFLVAGLSFYIGRSSNQNRPTAASVTGHPVTETPASSPTPSPVPVRKVTAGGILNFPKYELSIPDDWENSRESQTKDDERIILVNGDYKITITQGGFGGAVCLFPGDPDQEGPSARYDAFKDITTKSGDKLRRAWTGTENAAKGFAICQNTQYGWGAPTLYGHISYSVPANPTEEKLGQMDGILASITKI